MQMQNQMQKIGWKGFYWKNKTKLQSFHHMLFSAAPKCVFLGIGNKTKTKIHQENAKKLNFEETEQIQMQLKKLCWSLFNNIEGGKGAAISLGSSL